MSHQRRYRLAGAPLLVRLSLEERQRIEAYADERRIPLAQAVRRLMAQALSSPTPPVAQVAESTPVSDVDLELAMLNLIATEQVLQLLESIAPEGPGAARAFATSAARAAQDRIAIGSRRR